MSDDKCKNIATVRRCWPWCEPDLVCVEHAQDSQTIATVMGFVLSLEPVGYSGRYPQVAEFPMCCCSAGFSQTVEVES